MKLYFKRNLPLIILGGVVAVNILISVIAVAFPSLTNPPTVVAAPLTYEQAYEQAYRNCVRNARDAAYMLDEPWHGERSVRGICHRIASLGRRNQ